MFANSSASVSVRTLHWLNSRSHQRRIQTPISQEDLLSESWNSVRIFPSFFVFFANFSFRQALHSLTSIFNQSSPEELSKLLAECALNGPLHPRSSTPIGIYLSSPPVNVDLLSRRTLSVMMNPRRNFSNRSRSSQNGTGTRSQLASAMNDRNQNAFTTFLKKAKVVVSLSLSYFGSLFSCFLFSNSDLRLKLTIQFDFVEKTRTILILVDF